MRPERLSGKILGHYLLQRPIAVGGTATVFLAQDVSLQRDVALKLFQPREGDTHDFLRRFAREARVVAQLDHTNILPVYEYGEQDGQAYLVMPRMASSLRDLLRKKSSLSPAEAVTIISPILHALQYAHTHGLIHRDIKPGNILFKSDGTPMLSDFGLVKVLNTSNDQTLTPHQTASMIGNQFAGTPDYMSPEQIMGQATPASDIYSTGVVLYEMLTGIRPFSADTSMGVLIKQVHEQPRPLRNINSAIPAPLEAVVLRALAKDTAKRYQQPDELRQALERAVGEQSVNSVGVGIPSTLSYATDPMPTLRQGVSHEEHVSFPASHAFEEPLVSRHPQVQRDVPSSHAQQPAQHQFTPPLPAPYIPPRRRRFPRLLVSSLMLLLVVLVAGLIVMLLAPFSLFDIVHIGRTGAGVHSLSTPIGIKGGTTPQTTTGVTPVTQAVPPTTTRCPTSGTVRAAVTAPLVLGSHRDIIYIVNEGTVDHPTFGTLKRRDVDVNAKGIEIQKMAGVRIAEAHVSQDGQWILFVAQVSGQYQLRLVRVDGQGLQTLYCADQGTVMMYSQWSLDRHFVAFDAGVSPFSSPLTTYLLDLTSGTLQPELVPQGQRSYAPRTWLDGTHMYLTGFSPTANNQQQGLFLLDIQRGVSQHETDLKQVAPLDHSCDSFDTSFDLKQLLVDTCTSPQTGPSTIMAQSVSNGTIQTLYSSSTLAVTTIRAISTTTFLFLVENLSGDTSQNGLWKMNTGGSGITRLSNDTDNAQSLCPYSQYAWSNVSRDGMLYALESYEPQTNTYGMYYGSLSGGDPVQFASITGTQLFLVGWTNV